MQPVRFAVLGPPRLVDPTGREQVLAPRHRSLFAFLVLHAREVLSRDRLIDALWGEELPANPGNALQQRVFHLRRLLADDAEPTPLVTVPGGYRFEVADDTIDVRCFEQLIRAGREAVVSGDPPRAAELLAAGLALWRGEPLAGLDAPWAAAEAQRLHERRASATEDRIDADLALGRHAELVPELEALVAAHPLRERLRGQLMLALARSGRQADALACFEHGRRHLADELGIDPSPDLQQVHRDVLTQAAVQSAPSQPASFGTPLPAFLTRFRGREDELEQLSHRVATGRVVTLTGPGGAGKTRLAVEVLRRLETQSAVPSSAPDAAAPDAAAPVATGATPSAARGTAAPAVLVDLAAVREPAGVTHGLVTALDLRPPAGAPVLPAVARALTLRPRRLLLDGCEQLRETVAEVVGELVQHGTPLQVLITSRAPLGLDGETVWPVGPLPLPTPESSSVEELRANPAVALFEDRLRAALPDLDATDAEVQQIAELVGHLDGLPLAIELVAARLRTVSLPDLVAGLRDRDELLGSGRRSGPARQRTLAATLDWSWELLTAAERRAWLAAAVPVAPFDTALLAPLLAAVAGADVGGDIGSAADPVSEAAAGTAAGPGAGRGAAPDARVAAALLCDHSLLTVAERSSPTRYRMLSTVREYGLARLAVSGVQTAVRDAHASAVEAALARTDRTDVQRWEVDLDAQRRWLPDARAARRWRAAQGDRPGLQRLASGLGWLFYLTQHDASALAWFDEALGPLAELDPTDTEPAALLWATALRVGAADDDRLAWAQLAYDAADGPVQRHLAAGFIATFHVLAGDPAAAHRVIEAERAEGGWLEGIWRLLEGKLATLEGRVADAHRLLERAEVLLRDQQAWNLGMASDGLVHLAQLRGDVEALHRAAERGLAAAAEVDAHEMAAELRCMLAMAAVAVGDHDRADVELRRARDLVAGSELPMMEALLATTAAYLAWRHGANDVARSEWERALELHDWSGFAFGRPFAHWGLGHLALQDGEVAVAAAHQCAGLASAVERLNPDAIATALEGLGAVAVQAGDPRAAAELLGAARHRRAAMQAPAPVLTRDHAQALRARLRHELGSDGLAQAETAGSAHDEQALLALAASVGCGCDEAAGSG